MITKTLYVQIATFPHNGEVIEKLSPTISEIEYSSSSFVKYTTVNIIEVEIDDNYDVSVIAQELVA